MAAATSSTAAGLAVAAAATRRCSLLPATVSRSFCRRGGVALRAGSHGEQLSLVMSRTSFMSLCVPYVPSRTTSGVHGRRTFAAASGEFEKQLMPEDILHLRATSMIIMQDPVCELHPEEVSRYLLDRGDPIAELPLWHPKRLTTQVTQPFRQRKLAVSRLTDLIIERIDNEPLCRAFDIDSGFNMQVYFMIIHAWLLHQRFVLEGANAKKLDEELFESCWTLVRNWLWLKKTPEYRFDAELLNVQEYMLGACIAMDKALERPDILPARLQQVLWANVYSGGVKKDAATLTRLTKYCLRQLGLMLQLDTEHFLEGNFVWADFPVPDGKPPQRKQLPLWREEFGKIRKAEA
eukprot:TRINITY_DN42647_c0_g1_i1.p1 TRINITY_DN42647_c0_g1~~TRINITY_DN42647_c0_g1_i1.p1  ORF type:complete len:369 (-),score=62.94 TRINITY_DN42647_c0_g1_i1:59-1108(-)